VRTLGLRSAVAILIAITGVSHTAGSAIAETAAVAEPEAPEPADSGARDAKPTPSAAERRRDRREQKSRRGKEQMARARVVLLDGIELSAEQSRGLEAIIEAELERGRRIEELRAALDDARRQGDRKRINTIRAERSALLKQRKGPNESMEEMRALLTEEQRPTFDMNRARLVAERQQTQKKRPKSGPRAGAAAEAE